MSLQDVYDMSWAEFVLRSIALREEREREELLFREVAYQAYTNNFIFSKKRPEAKDRFWKIGNKKPIVKEIPEAFKRAREKYLKERS